VVLLKHLAQDIEDRPTQRHAFYLQLLEEPGKDILLTRLLRHTVKLFAHIGFKYAGKGTTAATRPSAASLVQYSNWLAA
jgi:hypothetical protein